MTILSINCAKLEVLWKVCFKPRASSKNSATSPLSKLDITYHNNLAVFTARNDKIAVRTKIKSCKILDGLNMLNMDIQ